MSTSDIGWQAQREVFIANNFLKLSIKNKSMPMHNYTVYIVTNPTKSVLYVGITNDLAQRLVEHYMERGKPSTFAGRYFCYNLLYYEDFQYVQDAIAREKEIKKWRRSKK